MSKIIKKLRQISHSAAPPMGFKTTTISPSQLMLVIAAVTRSNSGIVAQLTEAEADALIVHSHDLVKELQTIQKIAGSLNDIPWGVWPETVNKAGIEGLKDAGGDLLIFEASEAPASLTQEEVGKVIKITPPFEESLIRTIGQLPIDAVLLDFREEDENLTISQLMNIQLISDSINKPLLVAIQQMLDQKEIQALWEAGVKGVVMEVEKGPMTDLTGLRQAIAALSPASRKQREKRALLPQLGEEADLLSEDI